MKSIMTIIIHDIRNYIQFKNMKLIYYFCDAHDLMLYMIHFTEIKYCISLDEIKMIIEDL